jgi:prolyl-tRNA synthetase
MTRLDQYQRLYEEVFAIPVMRGQKPEHDKFPGAETTTTIEVLMPDGKSVQGATSHNLRTSFGEAYDVTFVDEDQEEQYAHIASWGLSWRALGALIMTHSDDQGLVLPPAMASTQAVIVPIWDEWTKASVLEYAGRVADTLEASGVRVELDERENRNPGYKFNEHELHGVPLRIEVGPTEVMANELKLVQRPDGATSKAEAANAVSAVEAALDQVHKTLYAQAEESLVSNIREAETRAEPLGAIGEHGGYVKTPWCGDEACEAAVKEEVSAEIVMVPFDDESTVVVDDSRQCTICGDSAKETAYFAQSH